METASVPSAPDRVASLKQALTPLHARLPHWQDALRYLLARRYLTGDGLEIGALLLPLKVPRRARVRYVDRYTLEGLREHYPELGPYKLVAPDIVDDGELLASVADASQDFVIANHVIEHTQDPIGALLTYSRVLRPGGILYMAVPDMRRTFDRLRPLTDVEHMLADHADGPAGSRAGHYLEWTRLVDGVPEDRADARAAELDAEDYSIHYHTFVPASFVQLVGAGVGAGLDFGVEEVVRQGYEFIAILSKGGPAAG
jgi:SAM-dependent methyltransferase